MSRVRLGTALAVVVLLSGAFRADETSAEPAEEIRWIRELPKAFAAAKAQDKVLMICINAKTVAGRRREEPAAKGLREIVYKDPRVVARSRDFVCAFLTPEGSSADYGELRALGISGRIVSPQHVFVAPAGDRIVLREEYWSHGSGESGVLALLEMMDAALSGGDAPPDPAVERPTAPGVDQPEEREAWIGDRLDEVRTGAPATRRAALAGLVASDQEGDCVDRVIALIPDLAEESEAERVAILVDLVRALGVDGLEAAAAPIATQLRHDEPRVRANAAVSLEHIGSKNKEITKELRARVTREKDVFVARHMARALGRCGVGETRTRKTLMKIAGKMDDRDWTFGALIGLASFEGDAKAARGIEKILQKLGPPRGGGGGDGFNLYTQRALAVWALAHIGDRKSGAYVAKTLMEPAEKSDWSWKERILRFYGAVVRRCNGDTSDEVRENLDAGLRYYLARLPEEAPWMDAARKGREHSGFKPKADWEVERRE